METIQTWVWSCDRCGRTAEVRSKSEVSPASPEPFTRDGVVEFRRRDPLPGSEPSRPLQPPVRFRGGDLCDSCTASLDRWLAGQDAPGVEVSDA